MEQDVLVVVRCILHNEQPAVILVSKHAQQVFVQSGIELLKIDNPYDYKVDLGRISEEDVLNIPIGGS